MIYNNVMAEHIFQGIGYIHKHLISHTCAVLKINWNMEIPRFARDDR